MSKLNKEVNRLNDDSEFIEFLTNEEEYEIETQSIYDHGFNQGVEQGIEQGSNEKTISIAKNLLKTNLTPEEIASSTGLTVDEVNNLKENY